VATMPRSALTCELMLVIGIGPRQLRAQQPTLKTRFASCSIGMMRSSSALVSAVTLNPGLRGIVEGNILEASKLASSKGQDCGPLTAGRTTVLVV